MRCASQDHLSAPLRYGLIHVLQQALVSVPIMKQVMFTHVHDQHTATALFLEMVQVTLLLLLEVADLDGAFIGTAA